MIDNKILNKTGLESVKKFLNKKGGKSLLIEGLYSSAKAFLLAETIEQGLHIIILNSKEDALSCANDLYKIKNEENIYLLPSRKSRLTSSSSSLDVSSKVQFTAAIGAIVDFNNNNYKDDYLIIVTYASVLEEQVVSEQVVKDSVIEINKGDNLSHNFIKEVLFEAEFKRVEFVSQPGEFALRGAIIDIFSFGDNLPYRLDFFGDEIEEIKSFDINSQRSIKSLEQIKIYPQKISASNETISIKDFISMNATIWLSDINNIEFKDNKLVFLSSIFSNINTEDSVKFNTQPQPTFNKNFDLLSSDINDKKEKGYEVYILSESASQVERLESILYNYKVKVKFENYTIHEGFIDIDQKVCLYTDHQIFERFRKIKNLRVVERSERLTLNDLNALREGDFIVHIDHGVGKFGGLVKSSVNGKTQEAIKLVYKNNDVIIVSIHGLHRISKYRSSDATPPKVSKLGTGAWEKLKSQTKSRVKDIAADLIKLYSQRRVVEGFAFSPDSYMQQELESSFKYEETPDQLRTMNAVKEDMEKKYPMDRLVCGDVGFGKTEVAVRAAFKAVADSKQVAVLVPTTILALQHYKTFVERLKNFPCNIEYISRIRTAKEIKEISQKLKEGKIDIVIGTHRLLNKEIIFKDLGLLIIDEEQKFGVSAKERLRQIKTAVDTLTLSATPIPRTLQFSLLGARDLSIISTPPPNRLPIQTEIINFNEDEIREIINYELERGGQIFFIHNRVEDIHQIEEIIRRIKPDIDICVGHGQLEPKELERRILNFIRGDYDIMIATSIVENGIDIPNVNTIIINKAQNFGLSDLHQLRGRVGRSNRKAFCYLIVPPMISLSDDARRRIKAIEAFSDLGSGFNIAMQDLDIRGMGNMLGAQQSGYIADMGFEVYQKILAEAFDEIKQEHNIVSEDQDEVYVKDFVIDTDMELLIPDTYINITAEKIRLYRELDSIESDEKLNILLEELSDRYGPIPEELRQLSFVVKLRRVAKELGFEKIILKNEKLILYFISNQMSNYYRTPLFSQIIQRIQSKNSSKYQLKENKEKLYLTINSVKTIEKAFSLIEGLKE